MSTERTWLVATRVCLHGAYAVELVGPDGQTAYSLTEHHECDDCPIEPTLTDPPEHELLGTIPSGWRRTHGLVCAGITAAGTPCQLFPRRGRSYCHLHDPAGVTS